MTNPTAVGWYWCKRQSGGWFVLYFYAGAWYWGKVGTMYGILIASQDPVVEVDLEHPVVEPHHQRPRVAGFYWVKHIAIAQWSVAYWCTIDDFWVLCDGRRVKRVEEIDERRIIKG